MSGTGPSGTEGYAGEAETLFRQYESISFADVHRHIMPLMPSAPARIVDVGAGTGRDAAGLAELGYLVTAIEPTAELRTRAQQLHTSPRITWLDDSLPELRVISQSGATFDVVMLTAVWMHLDEMQRRRAMPAVAALVCPGGLMSLSLRHGPVPTGRRMFEVSAEETIALAQTEGLNCVQRLAGDDSLFNRPNIRWDRLTFRR